MLHEWPSDSGFSWRDRVSPHVDTEGLLALKAAGELSAREIGAVLGKREGAVRVALHRTIQQLRAALHAAEEDTHA